MSPYDVLQVSSRATEEEVRTAYKAMVSTNGSFLEKTNNKNSGHPVGEEVASG